MFKTNNIVIISGDVGYATVPPPKKVKQPPTKETITSVQISTWEMVGGLIGIGVVIVGISGVTYIVVRKQREKYVEREPPFTQMDWERLSWLLLTAAIIIRCKLQTKGVRPNFWEKLRPTRFPLRGKYLGPLLKVREFGQRIWQKVRDFFPSWNYWYIG